MANLNKELKKLFFATLKRKAEEASRRTSPTYGGGGYCGGMMPPVTHRPTTYQSNLFSQTDGVGCIYFYEWSDTTRIPKSYYTLKAFEAFLNDCHIYLASWQREVLSHMKHSYVACKRGERDIIIKGTFPELSKELNKPKATEEGSGKKSENPFPHIPSTASTATNRGSEDVEPYSVAITRPPSMRHMEPVFEPEGRWDEEGRWFG
jgi:hypothetical protein